MEIVGVILDLRYIKHQKDNLRHRKLEVILKTTDIFQRIVALNIWDRNINKYTLEKGQKIRAHISASSKSYGDKWYTNLNIHDVDQL
jgi:hypothetical protein